MAVESFAWVKRLSLPELRKTSLLPPSLADAIAIAQMKASTTHSMDLHFTGKEVQQLQLLPKETLRGRKRITKRFLHNLNDCNQLEQLYSLQQPNTPLLTIAGLTKQVAWSNLQTQKGTESVASPCKEEYDAFETKSATPQAPPSISPSPELTKGAIIDFCHANDFQVVPNTEYFGRWNTFNKNSEGESFDECNGGKNLSMVCCDVCLAELEGKKKRKRHMKKCHPVEYKRIKKQRK